MGDPDLKGMYLSQHERLREQRLRQRLMCCMLSRRWSPGSRSNHQGKWKREGGGVHWRAWCGVSHPGSHCTEAYPIGSSCPTCLACACMGTERATTMYPWPHCLLRTLGRGHYGQAGWREVTSVWSQLEPCRADHCRGSCIYRRPKWYPGGARHHAVQQVWDLFWVF